MHQHHVNHQRLHKIRRQTFHQHVKLLRQLQELAFFLLGASATEEGYHRLYRENANRLKPFTVLNAMNGAAGSHVAMQYQLLGSNLTYSTACSSSNIAIGEAYRNIKHGYSDVAFAGGSEALLTFGTIKAWEALRTLAEEDPNDASTSCKPFSLNRTGLVLGEGAAVLILEEMEN